MDRRAPSAFPPGLLPAGARSARAEGQVSTGHRAGASLSCPEKLSLSYCYVSTGKYPLPLNKNPLGAPGVL